jgi:shikimate dehydrogenase
MVNPMRQFGLIGFPLGHSFSKRYFTDKFQREGITDAHYELFPLEAIEDFVGLLQQRPNLCGLNVTIPYKQAVMPYLDRLDDAAAQIGAVNCIKIAQDGTLTGHNTDVIGFGQSLDGVAAGRWAGANTKAIVLGNGGAAKAVFYALQQRSIAYTTVARRPDTTLTNEQPWDQLDIIVAEAKNNAPHSPVLIVNTTPIGMAPHADDCPDVPFDRLDDRFLIFDLVYNPEDTLLLQRSRQHGAHVQNGLEMLYLQANAAWEIWNNT